MKQKLIRFVKFQGILLAFKFLEFAYDSYLELELGGFPTAFWYEPTLIVVWLLPLLWSAQGVLLFMGVIRGYPRIMKFLNITSVGTFGLEAILLLLYYSLDSIDLTCWIIYVAFYALYGFYVLRTLEQMFVDLEKKRQEAVVINAIVCEGGGGTQSNQISEPTQHLPELYAIGAIQALRRLFQGWDKKSAKVGSEMPQSDRPSAEPKSISATEMARQFPPGSEAFK